MPLAITAAGAIFYARRGASGPALICIHGAGGTHAHWGYQLRDLDGVAQVYTIDLPGHGRSALPGRASIAGYGLALHELMDAIGLERAALVGHSMGGAIALWTALERPERVAGLGLVGAGARLRVAPAILEGLGRDLPATIRLIVEYSYAAAAPPELRARAEASYALCDPVVYRDDFVACDGFDVAARLPAIRCPAAIVCGAEDRMTPPKYGEQLRAGLPDATLTLVPGAGHMLMIERPAAVSEALRALAQRL
ncbi:MAG TPA: alpha/beta fold hydrolase [Roseiflexaceae bacterium]